MTDRDPRLGHPQSDPYQLVNEVFARYYPRAADHRDPMLMAALFSTDATLTIYYRGNGDDELLGNSPDEHHRRRGHQRNDATTTGMEPPHHPQSDHHRQR